MPTVHTGGDGAGLAAPPLIRPIRSCRGPYRIIAVMTTVLMLIGVFALMPIGAGAQVDQLATTDNLNLRTAPSLDASIIEVMPEGTVVELQAGPENGFYRVDYDGLIGWAHGDYLVAPGTGSEAVATSGPAVDGSDGYGEDEIVQIIYAAADMYGQPREDMLRVARCESVLDPSAVNPSSNASGLFQFLPSTWATTPYADQNIFDPVANAEAAGWMWENGRRGEWVCQ